ncbi:carboxylating nicotinate-nucleotide diphosphorylase [Xanthomonadaceae bacterium XH05]|nr:carboxylating nicotinate-nucleotide diphosphorylase [Xanthomonadaceae bacterium XH05]
MLPSPPPTEQIAADVARALSEDIGSGDASAELLPDAPARARIVCREAAVVAGLPWVEACFRALDPDARFEWALRDGEHISPDQELGRIHARSRALVSGERCALNFLQTLSGTATVTATYAAALVGSGTRILDTRKTVPGLRLAQKYAVRCGGGANHRIGLYDAVMLKENHLIAAGSIAIAVRHARSRFPDLPLICEVESLTELAEAIEAGVDRVLIDDFSFEDMHRAVALAAGRVPLEASGSVTLDTLPMIAATGVDFVSSGALTKHIRAIDYSMRLIE